MRLYRNNAPIGCVWSPSARGQHAIASEKRAQPPSLPTASPPGVSPVEISTLATRLGAAIRAIPAGNSSDDQNISRVLFFIDAPCRKPKETAKLSIETLSVRSRQQP